MKSIIPLAEINQDFPAKETFIKPTKYQNLGVEFEDDPVWHARKLQGEEIIIGKKRLNLK